MIKKIPKPIIEIIQKLEAAGFESFVVGGCVRDLLMDVEPKDWDLTTNAKPDEVMKIFPDSFYENAFGTVGVKIEPMFSIITKGIVIDERKKKKAIEVAKKYLNKIECPIHGICHAENVIENIKDIAKDYKEVNLDVLELAGYFHDVGRTKYEDRRHVEESQKIARDELGKIFDGNVVKILSGIVYHGPGKAKSLEEEMLREADLIDGISEWRIEGAIKNNIDIHIEWIKNDYQNLVERVVLRKGKDLMKVAISKANKILGTNLVLTDSAVDVVEVTTYRIESKYSDKRRPDKVKFAKTLEEDLSRRDFTINALALRVNYCASHNHIDK